MHSSGTDIYTVYLIFYSSKEKLSIDLSIDLLPIQMKEKRQLTQLKVYKFT